MKSEKERGKNTLREPRDTKNRISVQKPNDK